VVKLKKVKKTGKNVQGMTGCPTMPVKLAQSNLLIKSPNFCFVPELAGSYCMEKQITGLQSLALTMWP